jgi:transglutaminase superfamily protein
MQSVTSLRRPLFLFMTLVSVLLGAAEIIQQAADARYVRSTATAVIEKSGASTPGECVIALRDYLRANITFRGAPSLHRPFLRATAADTLRSRRGYCGEVTRAFICMASTAGVRARRINLYGSKPHVVAEAELAPGRKVIVDCQNPPRIAGLERLDQVIRRPEFEDYSTLNLRRLHISWLVARLKPEMGPLTYWTENPHALKALIWFSVPMMLIAVRGMRALVGFYLRRQGWVRLANTDALQQATAVPLGEQRIGF